MSATIIDFNAFRPNRPVADSVTRDRTSTTAAEGVLAGPFFYPVFLAWPDGAACADRETT